MRLQITKRDIQKGVRRNPASCPIAHAMHRAGYPLVNVNCYAVTIYQVNHDLRGHGKFTSSRRGTLSRKAEQFIDDFDRGLPVKPFTTIVTF